MHFNSNQMADWEALFAFHREYLSPELLPTLPHTLSMPSERSYTMKGPPPWNTLWKTLRRFPRPHHSQNTLAAVTNKAYCAVRPFCSMFASTSSVGVSH
jgi:hypothetical protein